MGVYGTQTALAVPTLDDKIMVSDAGVSKASTLQQLIDVMVTGIDADDIAIVDAGTYYATSTVEDALQEVGADLAGLVTPAVSALTPTTGTVDLDMATVNGSYLTHSLSGNVTYTTSNRAAGRSVTIKVIAGASLRTLTFPSWIFVGTEPTDIAASKTGILTVTFFDGTDAAAVAAWAVEA